MVAPTCTIIGGPNGAGKTTFAMSYLPVAGGCRNFINADLIASGLSQSTIGRVVDNEELYNAIQRGASYD